MTKFVLLKIIICICIFTYAKGAELDNVRFVNISVYNGLPHNCIFDIFQDSKGFMWIATRDGLCCYDGYDMRYYTYDAQNENSIPHNAVRDIFEDSKGRLWVATEGGVCCYDRDNDKFVSYYVNDKQGYACHYIYETMENVILVSTSSYGLLVYNESSDSFAPMFAVGERSPIPSLVHRMVQDDQGLLWLATIRGIRCLDIKSRSIIKILPDNDMMRKVQSSNMHSLAIDKQSRVWFGGLEGLFVYNPATRNVEKVSSNEITPMAVRTIEFDGNGNTWVGGEHGLDIIDANGRIRHFKQGLTDISNLSDNAIYVIHRDQMSNMWLGTYFGGVNVMFTHMMNFSTYPYGFSNRHLSGKAVRQIIKNDEHSILIATEDGGLNLYNRTTREFEHYSIKNDQIALNIHNIHSLLKDRSNNLWIGTFQGGINKYNISTGGTSYPQCWKTDKKATLIFSLLEDSHGDIWIGTSIGLFYKQQNSDQIKLIDKQELSNTFIYSMAYDKEGLLWIGTRRMGLYSYDHSNDILTKIPSQNPFQNFVTTIYIDNVDNVWVGTDGGGLRYLDRSSESFVTYTVNNALPSNAVMGIVQDDSDCIWISTDNGLCRFSKNSENIVNYTVGDGMPINQFNYGSAYKADDGELFFGSVNGMISFYPHNLKTRKEMLRVKITDFKVQGNKVVIGGRNSPLSKNITETTDIVLNNSQASSFSFGYTALNFSHTATIKYAIKMGDQEQWQSVGNQHQILFSNLPHGKYRFAVKASYDGVVWDEQGACYMNVEILPPFYLSGWAYMIYFILGFGVIVCVYLFVKVRFRMRERINSERTAKVQAEVLNRQKMVLFGNISHDLKTPLTLILGPLQRMVEDKETESTQRNTLSVVLQNAQRMRNLLEELVLLSKIEMGHMKITVQPGDVIGFIDRVCDIFRMFASDNGINFFVNIDPSHHKVWFSPINIERIVYNLLSNAFKFTPHGGVVRIRASVEMRSDGEQILSITVKDTGCGIAKDMQQKIFENYYTTAESNRHNGAGIGLALTKSLVGLHKGEIGLESDIDQGATFFVTLNVSRDAYLQEQISDVHIEDYKQVGDKYIMENNKYLQQARIEIQSHQTRRFQVLVVEDNPELREFVKQIFIKDFDILTANDGVQGYDMAVQLMPDIIISDIMMPLMNGLDMASKLKSELLTSHIPIVLLTAKVEEMDKIEGFECGADAYIEKPFNTHRLELQVKNLLNTRNNNIQRFKHDTHFDTLQLARNPRDEKFINSIVDLIMSNLDNDQFAVKDITDNLGISRSLLHIKLKNLADLSVSEFIRNIRMKEARERLLQGMNVSEASFAVGISDPNYFTKCFKKQFGQTPSDFIRNIKST